MIGTTWSSRPQCFVVERQEGREEKGKDKMEIAENGAQKYVQDSENKKFKKAVDALKYTHKDAVSAREKQVEEYTKL